MRANPRRRIDQQAADAARALELRREAVLPSDHALADLSTVRRPDVDRAVAFYREAVAGSGLEALLNGPARGDERE